MTALWAIAAAWTKKYLLSKSAGFVMAGVFLVASLALGGAVVVERKIQKRLDEDLVIIAAKYNACLARIGDIRNDRKSDFEIDEMDDSGLRERASGWLR